MVAADDDRCTQHPARDEVIEREAGEMPFAVTEPADARWQPLALDLLAREPDPALQAVVVGERREHRVVGRREVRLVTRQAGPAERAGAAREQRPDVGDDETRITECVVDAGVLSLTAQAVA